MKNITPLFFGCALQLLLTLSAGAQAQNYSYATNNGAISITRYIGPGAGYNGSAGAVAIPATIDGLPVTTIGVSAFEFCNLTSVTFPDSVTTIQAYAFHNCQDLASVTIGNSVTSIEHEAFANCCNLTNLILGNHVTTIDYLAFVYDQRLTSVTIPSSVTSLGYGAFMGCTVLAGVYFEGNAPVVSWPGFDGAMSIIYYKIGAAGWADPWQGCPTVALGTPGIAFQPANQSAAVGYAAAFTVAAVGEQPLVYRWRFNGQKLTDGGRISGASSSNLTISAVQYSDAGNYSVIVTNRLGSVASFVATLTVTACPIITLSPATSTNAIWGGTYTQALTAAGGTGPYTFAVTSGVLPDGLNLSRSGVISGTPQNLGAFDFTIQTSDARGCTGSGNYTLNVTTARDQGFIYTTNNGAITITKYTGSGGAVAIPDTIDGLPVVSIGYQAFNNNWSLTSVTIGNNLVEIGAEAFYNDNSLGSVMIGSGVASIGSQAFDACFSLSAITVDASNTTFSSVDGVLFNKSQTSIIRFPMNKPGSYVIPNTVTSIESFTFAYCSLTGITIPDSVTTINGYTFEMCRNLASVTIPNSVTSIGDIAFANCVSLTNVTIGNRVASIGGAAFCSCKSLTSITVPSSVTFIDVYSFAYCSSLTNVLFQGNAPATDMEWQEDGDYWVSSNLEFEGSPATIYYYSGTTGWTNPWQGRPTVRLNATAPLTILTSGTGTYSPNLNGSRLVVGKNYTVTAKPGPGCLISNWQAFQTGSATNGVCANARFTFNMQPNLVLVANFAPNQFIGAAGTYHGLFCQTNEVTPQSAGYFKVTTTSRTGKPGTYSGTMILAGETARFAGTFDVTGDATQPLSFKSASVMLRLHLAADGSDTVTGSVGSNDGSWTAALHGNRALFKASNPATAYAGRYTLAIPGSSDAAASPEGDGYGVVNVAANGTITVAGSLGDGALLSQSVPVSKHGDWPFYRSASTATGPNAEVIMGWLSLSNGLSGTVSWIKSPVSGDVLYPGGFTNETDIVASRYTAPALNNRAIDLNNGIGVALLEGGNLEQCVSNRVTLSPQNKFITSTNCGLTLSVTPKTGLLKGSFIHPASSGPTKPNGVVLQEQNAGRGFFKGTDQTGALRLQSN